MEYNWEDILERFNNNDLDVEKYFNDYQTFFRILEKRGLMSEVDPKNAVGTEHWQNEYLIWLYKNDKSTFDKWIPSLLNDVEYDENGQPFLVLQDRSDLGKLFCKGGRSADISRDTIETILSGEGDAWEPYWNTTDNVYRDVIEELNEKNLKILKELIISMLSGQQLPPTTELTVEISQEQGHDDYWEINEENVMKVIGDEESMKELLDEELSDLKDNLNSIHSNSYNSAYESDVWDAIWNELSTYLEGRGEWIYRPHTWKKDTQVQFFKIPINNLDNILIEYLSNNKGYGNSGTLEYQGSLINILAEDWDCLSPRVPDYPSYDKVDRNINEYFPDYI